MSESSQVDAAVSLFQIKFKVGLQAGQNKGATQMGQNLGNSRHM